MLGMRSSHVGDHPTVPVRLTGRTDTFWDGLGILSGAFCLFNGLRSTPNHFQTLPGHANKNAYPYPAYPSIPASPRRRAVRSNLELILVDACIYIHRTSASPCKWRRQHRNCFTDKVRLPPNLEVVRQLRRQYCTSSYQRRRSRGVDTAIQLRL